MITIKKIRRDEAGDIDFVVESYLDDRAIAMELAATARGQVTLIDEILTTRGLLTEADRAGHGERSR